MFPQLSSVEQDAKRIGYEAIVLLDRLMGGEKARERHFFIDPLGVVTRGSTDIMAVEDRLVAKTITFIQSAASQGIKVRDVVTRWRFRVPVVKLTLRRPRAHY